MHDMFVKHKFHRNGPFQRWPRSQRQFENSRNILLKEKLMFYMKTLIYIIRRYDKHQLFQCRKVIRNSKVLKN